MRVSKGASDRTWRPVRDTANIVHHATPVSKREAEYVFRLADTVRAVVGCGECGVAAGSPCVRKRDKQPMLNHSHRVGLARLMFEQHVRPHLDRLHQTLCSAGVGPALLIYDVADGHDIDCMTCLVVAAK